MNTSTLTLSTIVDRALEEVRRMHEVGRQVVRSAALTPTTTKFKLNIAANPTDVLEFDSELMLITIKSTDADPDYTVIRGYFGTVPAAHPANQPGLLNPSFTRRDAASGALRSLAAIEAGDLPLRTADVYTPIVDPNDQFNRRMIVPVAAETREVWAVRCGTENVPRVRYRDDLAKSLYSTGKAVILPDGWDADWEVSVTTELPYRWSSHPDDPDEDDTVEVPEGAEFLPSSYAAAWMLSGREVSRSELDRSEEYGRVAAIREGVTRAVVRDAWQSFYRKLDEASRINMPAEVRPVLRMGRF